jgi:integrase
MEDNEIKSSQRYTREKALVAFKEIAPDEDEDLVDAKAPRTLIQYGSVRRVWARWREAHNLPVMPATAAELRDFVRHLKARKLSPATLAAYVSGLTTIHRYNGHRLDTTLVIEHLKAARQSYGPQKRAKPLLARTLKDLVGRLETRLRDARDKPMLMLAFAFAGRSAEVVGLDLERAGSTLTGTTGVVTMGEPDAIVVTLLSSKASQTEEVEIEILDKEMPTLRPALEAWIERAGITPGMPLFPATVGNRVTHRRLASESIRDIVRRRVAEYAAATGKPPAEAMALAKAFSSHSIRRGYCTSASRARVPLADIRKRSRHRSDAMVARYVGEAEGRRNTGLAKIGF